MRDLKADVRAALTRERLIKAGARVLIGVSGGADSVTLAHVMAGLRQELRLWLGIVHVNHGLRPEAPDDAACVRALGAQLALPVTVFERDVAAEIKQAGWSLEDGARRIRYRAFLEAAGEMRATHVALAHTADDQAETVLMRLMRGAGLSGLSAIPISRALGQAQVIRPLLGVWRREVLAYARAHHLSFRHDATNDDPRFVRNRIRHHLLPLLEREYNPQLKVLLVQVAEQCRTDAAYLQDAARRYWKRLVKARPGEAAIRIDGFLRQPKALQRQLVRLAIHKLQGNLTGFEFRHWVEIERLFAERPVGTTVDVAGGTQFERGKERVVVRRVVASARESRYTT